MSKTKPAKAKPSKATPPPEPKVHQMIFRLDDDYRARLVALQMRWSKGTLNGTLLHLLDVYARERAQADQDRATLLEVERDLAELRTQLHLQGKAAGAITGLHSTLTKRLPLVRPLNRQTSIE